MLKAILKSFETIVIIAITPTSVSISFTQTDLIAIPLSAGVTCALTMSIKVEKEIVMKKHKKPKERFERAQQTNISFDN